MKGIFALLAAGSSVVAAISGAFAEPAMMTDQELMDALKDSAPAEVLKDATILNMGADGQMKLIKKGYWRLYLHEHSGRRHVRDEAGMAWGEAWQTKAPPPQKLGFIYRRQNKNLDQDDDFEGKVIFI